MVAEQGEESRRGDASEQARVSAVIDIDDGLKDAIYPPNSASSSRRESGGVGPLPGFSGRPKPATSASGVSASAAASESAATAEPRTQSEIEIQAVSSQCRHPSGAAAKRCLFSNVVRVFLRMLSESP